jgi:ABC-type nitrate/sulfonate/bicarbonate transport system substrate-binding protein
MMSRSLPSGRRTGRSFGALVVVGAALLTACGNDTVQKAETPTTIEAPAKEGTATTAAAAAVSASGISAARCEANKKAGKITYLSGFDFAASASIVEVVVAQKKGYFAKMCLDVDVKPGGSTENYPVVGANKAQFASAGSFTEMLNFQKDGASFVAVAHEGKVGVDALLVRADGGVKTPADLKGKTIGVKFALPPSEVALLAKYGLKQGRDYKEVPVQDYGFDPIKHWALPIDALPVYKSNEPRQLDQAGLKYVMFDPAAEGIPGSFGIIYTNATFAKEHPTAVQDFVRAAMRGMEDAIAKPDEAVDICFAAITAGGNKAFLSDTGERYRWNKESKIVLDSTPAGEPVGLIHQADLEKLVDAYLAAGVLSVRPKIEGTFDSETIKSVYGPDGRVVWPS